MASNERKRQEKLARRAAKRKKHAVEVRRAAEGSLTLMSGKRQMQLAAASPVQECLAPVDLFERGIGTVIVSRQLPNDDLATSVFLLDVHCLGVKNAFFTIGSTVDYRKLVNRVAEREQLQAIDPACARKLVEGAEAYARDLGFSPHPDYFPSAVIFGDIDKRACVTEYVFGKDGKPFYVSSPYDSPAKSKRIVETLTRRCGVGNFGYMLMVGEPDDLQALGEAFEEDDEAFEEAEDGGEEAEGHAQGEPKSGSGGWLTRFSPFHRHGSPED
jgi:hypothetical protein